jgi:hypothetical protein
LFGGYVGQPEYRVLTGDSGDLRVGGFRPNTIEENPDL